jgi:hypothetical protein
MTATADPRHAPDTRLGTQPPSPAAPLAPSPRPRPRATSSRRPDAPGTPALLRIVAAVVVLMSITVGLVLAGAALRVGAGLDVIGHRTAGQVAATEDLYFACGDLDAQLADVLLAGDDTALAGIRADSLATYQRRRDQADADLQQATTVAGDDPAAQRAVRDVLDRFGRYQGLAAQAMLLAEREPYPAGHPPPDVLAIYRQATDTMRTTLDTAHTLADRNAARLDQSYQDQQAGMSGARRWLGLSGGGLLAALIGLQVVLRLRLRRRLNPVIVLATVVAAALVIGGLAVLAREAEQLHTAKKDAFDSLVALRQARAVSYDANADESRYLLDSGRAAGYEQAFLAKSQSLAGVASGGVAGYDAALAQALDAYRGDHSDIRVTGYFGTELRNITFAGERAAAEQTLAAYQAYQRDDRTIRDKARTDPRGAIAFSTATAPGNSNYDFARYDDALSGLIDINQRAFDDAIGAGAQALDGWTGLLPYGAAGLIVALVIAGVWPRLAEYR